MGKSTSQMHVFPEGSEPSARATPTEGGRVYLRLADFPAALTVHVTDPSWLRRLSTVAAAAADELEQKQREAAHDAKAERVFARAERLGGRCEVDACPHRPLTVTEDGTVRCAVHAEVAA